MDDNQTLYVAFLGTLLSSLLILIWLAPFRGHYNQKYKNLWTFPTEIIDRWSPNFVALYRGYLFS
jgi:hypothetical protein